jgi:hypothetical protein
MLVMGLSSSSSSGGGGGGGSSSSSSSSAPRSLSDLSRALFVEQGRTLQVARCRCRRCFSAKLCAGHPARVEASLGAGRGQRYAGDREVCRTITWLLTDISTLFNDAGESTIHGALLTAALPFCPACRCTAAAWNWNSGCSSSSDCPMQCIMSVHRYQPHPVMTNPPPV